MLIPFLILSGLVAGLLYFLRHKRANHTVLVLWQLGLTAFALMVTTQPFTTQTELFAIDALAQLFIAVLALISWPATIYYIRHAVAYHDPPHIVAKHNAGTVLFYTAIIALMSAAHLWLMWAFLEVTTLAAAVLVYHDRNRIALSATWKYLFICSVGIALAFAGILLLGVAGSKIGLQDYTFQALQHHAAQLSPAWVKGGFLLILVGFSAKLGTMPLFKVDVDAKDVAPTPVGALFSSVLLNAAFVALIRVYQLFAGTPLLGWMQSVLFLTGFSSVVIAAVYLMRTQSYKRLLAYSSMEHGGIVLMALATASAAGYYAAILHLVLHGLAKSALFFQVGQMHLQYRGRSDAELAGYFHLNPVGGMSLLMGVIFMMGIPPSGLFVSEVLVFGALFSTGKLVFGGLLAVLLVIVIFASFNRFLPLLFSRPATHGGKSLTHSWSAVGPLALLVLVTILGFVRPESINAFIVQAALELPLP